MPADEIHLGWNNVERGSLPEDGRRIDWIAPDGTEIRGGNRHGRLWFLPDGMYVYYTPSFWRYADAR